MGVYDSQIKEQEKNIHQALTQIKKLQKDIKELQEMNNKTKQVDRKITDSLEKVYSGIKSYGNSVSSEFMNLYLKQIKEIAKKNHLNNLSEQTKNDDRNITFQIEKKEEQIRSLRNKITQYEKQISYYKANNTAE